MASSVLTGLALVRSQRGLSSRIAKHLGISRSNVSMWSEIPAGRVPAIAKFTGIPRHLLRPDLWDAPIVRRRNRVPELAE